eukprot:GFYU01035659.1.p1 GENE.GFYU01035659.1~~GFYU01035659.1.p1  ORF type:complete len:547 (-),score=114.01 GFYU01035659.1:615-2255(-)
MGNVCSDANQNTAARSGDNNPNVDYAPAGPLDTTRGATSRVELNLRCEGLKNMDTFSKTDSLIAVFEKSIETGKWREVGRTGVIADSLSPRFMKSIVVDYFFESLQPLRFEIYDVDNFGETDLTKHRGFGVIECPLAQIVACQGKEWEATFTDPHHRQKTVGTLFVSHEQVQEFHDLVQFTLRAESLTKMDTFGSSDPVVYLLRIQEDGTEVPVYRTNVIKNTLNPVWDPFSISVQRLCNGDYIRPMKFEVRDWNRSGKMKLIGTAQTTLQDMLERGIQTHQLKNEKGAPAGILKNEIPTIFREPTFIEYITAGCEIALHVSVDFTGSNGDPSTPHSLHYIHGTHNVYSSAIQAVGEVLAYYDSDQLIPAYGFGGRTPQGVSHCFALNGQETAPEVDGVEGVLNAYRQALSVVGLSGPTLFAPTLRKISSQAQPCSRQKMQYHILLILTDGVLNDMPDSIREIVEASPKPLSIVIVGVGGADFTNMNILDADDEPLVANGRQAVRDIVQFVPFAEFHNDGPRLARAVLQEVPGQLVSYMKSQNIRP